MVSPALRIAKTTELHIPRVMEIYAQARDFMRDNGNENQWIDGYPALADLRRDIDEGGSYVVILDGRVVGTFFFTLRPEPTYGTIFQGEWLDDRPYGVLHRVASDGSVKRLLDIVLDFCLTLTDNIRIDTHRDNSVMRNALVRYGFAYCGIIYLLNGHERLAYQFNNRCI